MTGEKEMVEKKTIAIGALSLALILSFTYIGVSGKQPNYYCSDKQQIAYCESLSSTGVTCYTLPGRLGGRTCSGGWKGIDYEQTAKVLKAQEVLCTERGCFDKKP
jgi:hypothetical protein